MSKRIFLIEDDSDDREFFLQIISEIGSVTFVEVANNGAEALKFLELGKSFA